MTDSRTRRLRSLAALLREETLASQEEATERLAALGFAVTQATVSRDLEQLGAVKVKRGGVLSYALPDQIGAADWGAGRLSRILTEWALSIEAADQLVVIRTPPGSAHLVASAIDHAGLMEVAGTVSGDDTLFIAARDDVAVPALIAKFEALMGRSRENYA
ncbi:MAG: arginine repressor [Sphingosinicella sp.]|uniref:arginine repressor n=1 Tax=Sphingosinicella sp. TaxID=1917971 RepID=UPI004037E201